MLSKIKISLQDTLKQGCQMAYFQTPNHKLGKFWRVLQRKMLAYFSVIWSISLPFGIFYVNLVNAMVIWYVFTVLVGIAKKNLATQP
jgi:hypothetical protein